MVIVGGGSSGWMTAATLLSQFPNKKITLVESPKIPTVTPGNADEGISSSGTPLAFTS
ncbi:MAG: hypothetical protein CMI36_12425 [Owenweeksia sp.]|nr:hypothetical protein [Owenweeksia sp.]